MEDAIAHTATETFIAEAVASHMEDEAAHTEDARAHMKDASSNVVPAQRTQRLK